MLIKQISYESQLQLYLKKWENWKNVIDYSEFLNSSLSELIKNQQQVVAEKVKIEERERKIIQEIKKAEIKLKKIKNSEDKSSFIDELIKIKEELINLQIKTEKYKNLEEIRKSEKSFSKIKLEKVRRDLVTLKMEIEKSPLFNGSLKQLNQDLEILQEEKNHY